MYVPSVIGQNKTDITIKEKSQYMNAHFNLENA